MSASATQAAIISHTWLYSAAGERHRTLVGLLIPRPADNVECVSTQNTISDAFRCFIIYADISVASIIYLNSGGSYSHAFLIIGD